MSEEQVVRHCAPTLAGLKTGSMFGAWYPSARALREDLRGWNQRLVGKGVCFLPLRYQNSRALIYVYRPSRLRGDLSRRAAAELLEAAAGTPPVPLPGACASCAAAWPRGRASPTRWGCSWGIPPRTCGALWSAGPRASNVWGVGRSTGTRKKPRSSSPPTRSARLCTRPGTPRVRRWNGSP